MATTGEMTNSFRVDEYPVIFSPTLTEDIGRHSPASVRTCSSAAKHRATLGEKTGYGSLQYVNK